MTSLILSFKIDWVINYPDFNLRPIRNVYKV